MTLNKVIAILILIDVLVVSSCLSPRNYERIYRPCNHEGDYLENDYMYENNSKYNIEYKKDWNNE